MKEDVDGIFHHYITDEDLKKLLDAEWNKAIEAAINRVGNDHFVREQLLKLKK